MHYPHTLPPYEHQDVEQRDHWNDEIRALFWEQGLGKMKAGYDWALTNWQAGKIDTLIVVAPNGVHRDWISEAIKPSNPDNIYDQPLIPPEWHDQIDLAFYDGPKHHNKAHQQQMKDLFFSKKFVVLSMTYDSVKTKKSDRSGWIGGRLFLEKMLRERKCALLLDEASYIQNPNSKVTQVFNGQGNKSRGIAHHAVMRRILEGTPVDEGPLNIYSQMQFLHRPFWAERGFANYFAFKTYFAVYKEKKTAQGKRYPMLVRYQNIPDLKKLIRPHSSRLLKRDVLDLPPKIYSKMRFEMTKEQWDIYEKIRDELMLDAKEEGLDVDALITAEIPIVNALRLYQITAGYIPFVEDDNGEPVESVIEFKENPRLETATEWLNRRTDKTVVWCRFTRDIELLCDALGKRAVRYDGKTDQDQREANKQEWLRGDAQFLIPQIQAMARGHTLNIAPDVLYYTNDARLRLRRQSEDRTHRGKMNFSVTYNDMIANDTVDEKRIKSLRRKLNTAEEIMGDDE